MEKLLDALGDEDEEFAVSVADENCSLLFRAEQCVVRISHFIEKVNKIGKKDEQEKVHVPTESERMIQEMQKLIIAQMSQQKEFFAYQTHREKCTSANSVKLPKLELNSFRGNKLKWTEFWDAFECTVHSYKKLSDIERFNYLLSKLTGEAYRAVSGLALSNDNYGVAVDILKERFGKKQEIVDMHYKELMHIPAPRNNVESVKIFFDSVERHIRSLEVLEENVNQQVFVSMIRSKLPQDVLYQLELMKGPTNVWAVTLRATLREYVSACEHSQDKGKDKMESDKVKDFHNRPARYQNQQFVRTPAKHSAQTLFSNMQPVSGGFVVKRDHCRYCDQRHWSDECYKFRTIEDRKKQLKGSCYLCLRNNHRMAECKRSKTCVHCGELNVHHRSLCPNKFKRNIQSEPKRKVKSESVHYMEEKISDEEYAPLKDVVVPRENVMISSGEIVLMQTATTQVSNTRTKQTEDARLLLDCGSQRTYITQKLADKLGLKEEKEEELKLITFGSSHPTTVKTKSTTITLQLLDGSQMKIRANIVPIISGSIQRNRVDLAAHKTLNSLVHNVKLADTIPSENEVTSIELLLGNDYYLDLVLSQKVEVQPGLYLLGLKLGWLLTGRTSDREDISESPNMLILTFGQNIAKTEVFQSVDKCVPRKPDLEDFWNVETIGIKDNPISSDDELALEKFKETLIFEDGRYQVTWPWIEENPELPENRELALGRLRSCVKRMRSKPEFMKKYNSVIQDQLEKGVIEKVQTDDGVKHYIPHHAVIKPGSTTTKLRVVYDASAKSKRENKSLNECLRRGPVMLHDLCGMLMRFRMKKVALVADIEKAFLQIGLQPSQRDVTRFLWLKNINNPSTEPENIEEFRFCRVPFGVISSPFLLGATVDSYLESHGSDIANKLRSDIYVDNVITGTNSDSEAIHLYGEAKSMFNTASMNLREWLCNSKIVSSMIPSEDEAKETIMKVLGHIWNSESDTLAVRNPRVLFKADEDKLTKRVLLKVIASVFDTMGLFAPILLKGKVLLQDIWKLQYDWDDTIKDETIISTWFKAYPDLEKLLEFPIQRHILSGMSGSSVYTLLCFCDASSHSYSATVYLHELCNGITTTNLVFAKTRLAPIKVITIPILELMAVLIGVRCLAFVKSQLDIPIDGQYLWTDSQCVLGWIKGDNKLPVFVHNRVKEIKTHKDVMVDYVSTKENPADIATRGTSIKNLANNRLWWHGPEWLKDSTAAWTRKENIKLQEVNDAEQSNGNKEESLTVAESEQIECQAPFDMDEKRYSTLTRLLRVTAYVLRFVKKKSETR